MITSARRLLLACAACVAVSASPAAERAPLDIVRELQTAQDDTSGGRNHPVAREQRLRREFDDAIERLGSKAWESVSNRRALLIYLLRGGAERGTYVNAAARASGDEKILIEGAIAAAAGQDVDARRLLEPIDPRRAPADVGGVLALVKARLSRDNDKSEAMRLLDVARLLSPGGLIEETALRQQIFIVSASDDVDRFLALSETYLKRFSASPYFSNFFTRFQTFFTRAWIGADDSKREVIGKVADTLDAGRRQDVYLGVAREAILAGDLAGARRAVRRANDALTQAAPPRAVLYDAIARSLSAGRGDAVSVVRAVGPESLDMTDQILRASTLELVSRIDAPPSKAQAPAEDLAALYPGPVAGLEAATSALAQGAR